jgi:hypothetical protein
MLCLFNNLSAKLFSIGRTDEILKRQNRLTVSPARVLGRWAAKYECAVKLSLAPSQLTAFILFTGFGYLLSNDLPDNIKPSPFLSLLNGRIQYISLRYIHIHRELTDDQELPPAASRLSQ